MNIPNFDEILSPEPLSGDFLERYYVDLLDGRGEDPKRFLEANLRKNPIGNQQLLFAGYRGCGKSTELNKLQSQISDDFVVLNYSVLREFNPANINYVELFVIVMEKLFEMADTEGINIRTELLDSIQAWVNSEEIKKIKEVAGKVEGEIGAEGKTSVLWFAKFFGKVRAQANASFTAKKTITEIIEHRLSELIAHCNDLITEFKLQLPSVDKKGLVIIVEDMDKLSLEKAEELFFNHSHTLTSLRANVIFTFPISLQHNYRATTIKGNFDGDYELPMVKVKTKQGEFYELGREKLFEIINVRMGNRHFESNELIYKFIDISGGCLRDLFRMVRDAYANASVMRKSDKINEADYQKAYFRLKRTYENTIAEKRIDNQLIVSVEDYYETLRKVWKDPNKKTDNTEAALDLRQNLCILGYNGEGWCDVHPVVKDILEEREVSTL